MLDNYIKAIKSAISSISQDWIILGALIAVLLILAIGLFMTMKAARSFRTEVNQGIVIRSRSRRNIIFTIAFIFAIFSVMAVTNAYPGATVLHLSIFFYLSIPALVLLWAFICEAIFECIDDRNRRKTGMKVCYCDCPDCTVTVAAGESTTQQNLKPEKRQEEKENLQPEKKDKPTTEKQKKTFWKSSKPAEKKNTADESRREEIYEELKRVQQRERERAEMEQWRDEIKEAKSLMNTEEEELRRSKFEEERKTLAILARQAKAAEFGTGSTHFEQAPKPASKPAAELTAAPKPAPKLSTETAASVSVTKPTVSSASAVATAQPAEVITQKVQAAAIAPVSKLPAANSAVPAAKPAPTVKVIDSIEDSGKTSETITKSTITRTYQTSSVTTESKQDGMNTRFGSLQAKLDILRKDTANARPANKSETRGKYDETEVKSALADLIKSMNVRRGGADEE